MALGYILSPYGPAPAGALDLLTILGGTFHWFLSADVGVQRDVSVPGAETFAWDEQAGTGSTFTASTTAVPGYSAADATLNNRGSVNGNGTTARITSTWNPPAPATTNCWFYLVAKQKTWASGNSLMGGAVNTHMRIWGSGSTPSNNFQNGGTAQSKSMTLNQWYRIIMSCTGVAGSDKVKVGSSESTGLDLGTSNPTAFSLLGHSSTFGDYDIATALCRIGEPGTVAVAAADTWVTARYGAAVQV